MGVHLWDIQEDFFGASGRQGQGWGDHVLRPGPFKKKTGGGNWKSGWLRPHTPEHVGTPLWHETAAAPGSVSSHLVPVDKWRPWGKDWWCPYAEATKSSHQTEVNGSGDVRFLVLEKGLLAGPSPAARLTPWERIAQKLPKTRTGCQLVVTLNTRNLEKIGDLGEKSKYTLIFFTHIKRLLSNY